MEKEKKPFKILSLDGGGIKGLYIASLLEKLEKKSEKKAGECFDLIAGTSTGGLIALGLASGKSASDLVKLYEEKGNAIFPTSNNKFIRWFQDKYQSFKQIAFFGKYSAQNLKKALKNEFGELTIGELENLVLIPSFNMVQGMPRMFKYPHKEGGFFRDKDIPVVDTALATSSAPTYLPLHKYDNNPLCILNG